MPQSSMADEALKSLTDLLESVPGWITELEGLLRASTERRKEIDFEGQPADGQEVLPLRKPSKSSSLLSRPSKEDEEVESSQVPEEAAKEEIPQRPQLPHLTQSDALRISQRKRKTASALSDLSGPPRFRSKAVTVVYYDGEVQKQFESLVRAMGGSRNALRKGKMSARVDAMSRSGSSSSNDASSSEDQLRMQPSKLKYRTTRAMRVTSTAAAKDDVTDAFDRIDVLLEKVQAICEKAAHQILRDGDCGLEMRTAKEHVIELQKVGQEEVPALRLRAEKGLERQKRERERKEAAAAQKEFGKNQQLTPEPAIEKVENPFSSPGSLEVDLEADDSDEDEDEDIAFDVSAMKMGQFGIRSARVPAVGAT